MSSKGTDGIKPSLRAGEDEKRCKSSTVRKEQIPSSSAFCSFQVLSELDDAHPHWGE